MLRKLLVLSAIPLFYLILFIYPWIPLCMKCLLLLYFVMWVKWWQETKAGNVSVGSLIQSSWGIQVRVHENVNKNKIVRSVVDRFEEKSEEILVWTRRTCMARAISWSWENGESWASSWRSSICTISSVDFSLSLSISSAETIGLCRTIEDWIVHIKQLVAMPAIEYRCTN